MTTSDFLQKLARIASNFITKFKFATLLCFCCLLFCSCGQNPVLGKWQTEEANLESAKNSLSSGNISSFASNLLLAFTGPISLEFKKDTLIVSSNGKANFKKITYRKEGDDLFFCEEGETTWTKIEFVDNDTLILPGFGKLHRIQ